jgi:predicted nuclease with TOPRIM domain
MIWTLVALFCVLGTKFLTAVRLRGLRAKFEAAQPRIDELRSEVGRAEEALGEMRLQVTQKTELLNALEDVVRLLEESLKQPPRDVDAIERVKLMQTVERQDVERQDAVL